MEYLKEKDIPMYYVTTIIGTIVGLGVSVFVSSFMDDVEYETVDSSEFRTTTLNKAIPIEDDVPWEK